MMAVFVRYSQMKPVSICVLRCEDLARHSFYLDSGLLLFEEEEETTDE